MKTLLAAPNSIHKNYAWDAWLNRARSFGLDIFISDNSPEDSNRFHYNKHRIDYEWTSPEGKSSFQFICESQNKIRDKVLNEGYTHLFFLETDLLPPKSILDIFVLANVPVISAPYFIHKHKDTTLMNQELKIYAGEAITRNYSLSENFSFMDGNIKKCFSTGFGCSLIKSEVLEKISFRWIGDSFVKDHETGGSHPDSYFYADLQRAKIPAYMYTGITVKHLNSDWSKNKFTT